VGKGATTPHRTVPTFKAQIAPSSPSHYITSGGLITGERVQQLGGEVQKFLLLLAQKSCRGSCLPVQLLVSFSFPPSTIIKPFITTQVFRHLTVRESDKYKLTYFGLCSDLLLFCNTKPIPKKKLKIHQKNHNSAIQPRSRKYSPPFDLKPLKTGHYNLSYFFSHQPLPARHP
jgi:hypothetical protein